MSLSKTNPKENCLKDALNVGDTGYNKVVTSDTM